MCWDTGELADWHRDRAKKTEGGEKAYHEAAARGFDNARAKGDRHIWSKGDIEERARKEAAGEVVPEPAPAESRGIFDVLGAFVGRLRRRAVAH